MLQWTQRLTERKKGSRRKQVLPRKLISCAPQTSASYKLRVGCRESRAEEEGVEVAHFLRVCSRKRSTHKLTKAKGQAWSLVVPLITKNLSRTTATKTTTSDCPHRKIHIKKPKYFVILIAYLIFSIIACIIELFYLSKKKLLFAYCIKVQ